MTEGIVGVDEAGRGPVIGPLVVGAVRVDDRSDLDGLELADSKELSADRRQRLDTALRDRFEVEVVHADAQAIDDALEDRTLNDVEVDLFARAAGGLAADRVVADACDVDADRFAGRLGDRLDGVDVVAEHGADARYPVVSAASVVAKVERDAAVRAIADDLDADVGSGYPSDPRTVKFLEDWVADHGELPPYTRRSWTSAQRIVDAHAQRSLTDY